MNFWFIFSTHPLWMISNLTPLDWTTRLKARWLRLILSLKCSLNSGLLVPFTVFVLSLWASSCVHRQHCHCTKTPLHTHGCEGSKIKKTKLCKCYTEWVVKQTCVRKQTWPSHIELSWFYPIWLHIDRLFAEDINGNLQEIDKQGVAEEGGTWNGWISWWGAQYLFKENKYLIYWNT